MIDLLLDQALKDGLIEPQRPREYQRFVVIGVLQAYCFQITNPQLKIFPSQAADFACQGPRSPVLK